MNNNRMGEYLLEYLAHLDEKGMECQEYTDDIVVMAGGNLYIEYRI